MSRLRWTARRTATLLLIAIVWAATGVGVYLYLGSHRSSLAVQASRPDARRVAATSPLGRLPGTMYIAQEGTLYRLQHGTFTAILQGANWTQPAISPNGQQLLVVRHDYEYSDLYVADTSGHLQDQLTHDVNKAVELNHWSFYPRFSPDGRQIFYSYDAKDRYNSYNVVFSVYELAVGASQSQARKWTTPEGYTGGDVQPIPLGAAGVIYTKYTFDQTSNRILGQLWLTTKAGTVGHALTPAADDCSQPALAPDGTRVAMICTEGGQNANVEVASFANGALGPRQVVVGGELAAQPTWAPDDSGLVFLAPEGLTGHFELWFQALAKPAPTPTPAAVPTHGATPVAARTVKAATTPTPPAIAASPTPAPTPPPPPVQLTTNLDFDATSTIAWHV